MCFVLKIVWNGVVKNLWKSTWFWESGALDEFDCGEDDSAGFTLLGLLYLQAGEEVGASVPLGVDGGILIFV